MSKLLEQVRQSVLSCGATRYELSRQSGVSQAQLCRFMQGHALSVENIERLAEALGCEIRWQKRSGKGTRPKGT